MNLSAAILVGAAAIRKHHPSVPAAPVAETVVEAVYECIAERAATLGLEREWEQLSDA